MGGTALGPEVVTSTSVFIKKERNANSDYTFSLKSLSEKLCYSTASTCQWPVGYVWDKVWPD